VRELCSDWNVLRVETGREVVIAQRLAERQVEQFLPTYQEKRKLSHRAPEQVTRVYFQGYVFVRCAYRERSLVFEMPGIYGFLDGPVSVAEMENVRLMIESGLCEVGPPVEGNIVEVMDGPYKGYRGIVVSAPLRKDGKLRNPHRIKLSVNIDAIGLSLSRPWPTEIDPSRLRVVKEKLSPKCGP
jgi:transcription antitermination factor NusG